MRKLISTLMALLLIGVALPAAAQDAGWPRTVKDGLGTDVTIQAAPQHIITLNLAADETLLPIIGPSRFAAATALSLDPGISNVALLSMQVATHIESASDTEQIIALNPDLVLVASYTDPAILQQLRDAGLTVFATGFPTGFDGVRANTRLLGQVVGAEAAVEDWLKQMDAGIQTVMVSVGEHLTPIRALYLTPGNYTSGKNSTIAAIIQAAGGIDVAAAADVDQSAPVSDEFIIEQDPDVILLSGWTPYDPTFRATFFSNPAFANLKAFTNGHVYIVSDAHMSTVSPFLLEGVRDAAAYLFPGEYPKWPLEVTDAMGKPITLAEKPRSVAFVNVPQDLPDAVRREMDGNDFDLIFADAEDGAIGLEDPAVVFLPIEMASTPNVTGATPTVIRLFGGDSQAAQVANLFLIGDALGQRVAALDAVAQLLNPAPQAEATPDQTQEPQAIPVAPPDMTAEPAPLATPEATALAA
jgi:iron complex transport system substrate-binding protein